MNAKAACLLESLALAPPGIVVEVGSLRETEERASDGFSTVYLSRACGEAGRRFYSLERDPETARLANEVLQCRALPEAVVAVDAVWALPGLADVAMLYLDGGDSPDEALQQLLAARLLPGAVLVVDDCQAYGGREYGKATRIVELLAARRLPFELLETEPGFRMLRARLDVWPTASVDGPPPIVNLITNTTNGVGLERDARLLQAVFRELGWRARLVHFKQPTPPPPADLNVYLEVVVERWLDAGGRNWIVPNLEWWYWDHRADDFEWILAKTYDCYRHFRDFQSHVVYTGFCSEDRYDPQVPREPRFLHVAGKSSHKNTQAVVEAWKSYRIDAPLTVVTADEWLESTDRIERRPLLSGEELGRLQNSHQFHVCPSEYEGWGHYLHEALGVGAVVITTDAPPMNEFPVPAELLAPPSGEARLRAARVWRVSPAAVALAVERCRSMSPERIAELSRQARAAFLLQRPALVDAVARLLRRRPQR